MRIALDAMGGDNAPDEIIAGAIEAASLLDKDDELVLVGPEQLLKDKMTSKKARKSGIIIQDAPEVIGMDESPVEALRKKSKSSIAIMAKLAAKLMRLNQE